MALRFDWGAISFGHFQLSIQFVFVPSVAHAYSFRMTNAAQYSDATRDSLQKLFGEGFTSPGGPEHMARLLEGLDIRGMSVMDLGCGLGGDSLLLAGEFGAGSVFGVDVDPGNLDVTRRHVEQAGLSNIIDTCLVEPGPTPFEDEHFDVVHSKAMICHIDNKADLFSEIFRVLKRGGTFVAADWMAGDESGLSQSFHDFADDLANAGLVFFFKTAETHRTALETTGFSDIAFRNVSPIIESYARDQLERVQSTARDDLIGMVGEEGYAGILRRSHGRVNALASGDLQFQYIRARRPD